MPPREELLEAVHFVVQYRRKEGVNGWFGFDPWHTMAAFDVQGAAEAYCGRQGNEFYEYRMIELPV
jgi:hypothetical protein